MPVGDGELWCAATIGRSAATIDRPRPSQTNIRILTELMAMTIHNNHDKLWDFHLHGHKRCVVIGIGNAKVVRNKIWYHAVVTTGLAMD